MISKPKLHTPIFDLDIRDYHGGTLGFSSSQFKDLLDDEDVFIAKHIDKRIAREEIAAFDVGTYFHTGILEPHKLKEECVVFPGGIRRGNKWEIFKKKNKGKVIVTSSQKDQATNLITSVKKSRVAKKFLSGKPEVSLFVEIIVCGGSIFAPAFGMQLTSSGWKKRPLKVNHIRANGYSFIVKVRADMLGKTYISDLKSTSANARSRNEIKKTISDYDYDLSAALYLDMFSLIRPDIDKFIWIFASKSVLNCKSWRASDDSIRIGRAKYKKAFQRLAKCAMNDWKLQDELEIIEPAHWDRDWLPDIDLI